MLLYSINKIVVLLLFYIYACCWCFSLKQILWPKINKAFIHCSLFWKQLLTSMLKTVSVLVCISPHYTTSWKSYRLETGSFLKFILLNDMLLVKLRCFQTALKEATEKPTKTDTYTVCDSLPFLVIPYSPPSVNTNHVIFLTPSPTSCTNCGVTQPLHRAVTCPNVSQAANQRRDS